MYSKPLLPGYGCHTSRDGWGGGGGCTCLVCLVQRRIPLEQDILFNLYEFIIIAVKNGL